MPRRMDRHFSYSVRFVARAVLAAAGAAASTLSVPALASDASASKIVDIRGRHCDGGLAANQFASKSMAVLGGSPSALDLVRMQQAGGSSSLLGSTATRIADASPTPRRLVPSVDASAATSGTCAALVATRDVMAVGLGLPARMLEAEPGEFLASRRVKIGRTNFDSDWQRVSQEKLPRAAARRTLAAIPASGEDRLASVNRWVNRQITYTEDRDLFGSADFWAGARRTLKMRRGDCEDIALLKMQLLAAAGVSRDDMILTIARDLVRQADHAVLIVRTPAGFRLLDNASDEIFDAAPDHNYRPILSFGKTDTWLHGA